MGAVPLPSTESMKTELSEFVGKKDTLLAKYRIARSQTQEYETIQKECGRPAVRGEAIR